MGMEIPGPLETLCSSDCRVEVVHRLLEGKETTSSLEGALSYDGSTVRRNVKTLADEGWVERRGDGLRIPRRKRFLLESFVETISRFRAFTDHRDFWDGHRFEAIPDQFLDRLNELEGCGVVRSEPPDVFSQHRAFIEELYGSSWMRGVSPIYHSDYSSALVELSERMEFIDVILTEWVYDRFLEDGGEPVEEAMERENVRIRVSDQEYGVAFTVTDRVLSLGLFGLDGNYDIHEDLMCRAPSAMEWGEDLFDYYVSRL